MNFKQNITAALLATVAFSTVAFAQPNPSYPFFDVEAGKAVALKGEYVVPQGAEIEKKGLGTLISAEEQSGIEGSLCVKAGTAELRHHIAAGSNLLCAHDGTRIVFNMPKDIYDASMPFQAEFNFKNTVNAILETDVILAKKLSNDGCPGAILNVEGNFVLEPTQEYDGQDADKIVLDLNSKLRLDASSLIPNNLDMHYGSGVYIVGGSLQAPVEVWNVTVKMPS